MIMDRVTMELNKEMQEICDEGGFEWTPLSEKKPEKYTLTVDENGILTFPDELLKKTGWKEGDVLEWIDNNDGSLTLVKIEHA
jgi:hypothetical protein